MKISISKLDSAVMSIEAETFSEQLQVAYIADLLREKDVVFHFFNDGEGSKGISIQLVGSGH